MNNAFYYNYGQSGSCIGDLNRFEPFCLDPSDYLLQKN